MHTQHFWFPKCEFKILLGPIKVVGALPEWWMAFPPLPTIGRALCLKLCAHFCSHCWSQVPDLSRWPYTSGLSVVHSSRLKKWLQFAVWKFKFYLGYQVFKLCQGKLAPRCLCYFNILFSSKERTLLFFFYVLPLLQPCVHVSVKCNSVFLIMCCIILCIADATCWWAFTYQKVIIFYLVDCFMLCFIL